VWFQQDSANAHTTDNAIATLEGVSGDRLINRGLWPVHSPHLTPCNFYLRGNLKDRMNPPYARRVKESIHGLQSIS
jgi:hypothetical protein